MLVSASAALVASALLLFVPITVVYVTSQDDPAPHDISTRYSWWITEQTFVYSDTGTGRQAHLVDGVRLDCANVVRTGSHELAQAPAGPQACAAVQTPRCIVALSLFALGLVGLLGVARIPATSKRYHNRYRQPYSQRRALKRGR